MYTSGCPKNQKRCWYRIGSPPPAGSKKDVEKFRSVNSIVIAPASTGRESSRRKAVIRTDHTKRGMRCRISPGPRMLKTVTIKLIAPRIEDAPDKCKEKMARSTAPPEWDAMLDKGGYTVHPVPTPTSTRAELSRSNSDGGSNQKLMLFSRGNAMSGAPIMMGTNQFPNPPMRAGITMKKIMRKAWAVISTL